MGVAGMGQERNQSRRNFTPGVFPVGNGCPCPCPPDQRGRSGA
jgi:hypothetical protein